MKNVKGLKRKQGGSPQIVGVAWYYTDQWDRLLDVASDRETLEDHHEDWLRSAENAMFEFKRIGLSPKKVYVDIEKLIEWCKSENRPVDSSARAVFVSKLLIEASKK
jgi:hypothetical protein